MPTVVGILTFMSLKIAFLDEIWDLIESVFKGFPTYSILGLSEPKNR